MFKKNFVRLCMDRGEAPSAVCKAIGLSNAAYSQWTDETIPRKTTLLKFADYFGVSVDTLLAQDDTADVIDTASESKKVPTFISYKSDSIENAAELLKHFDGRGIIIVADENKKPPEEENLSEGERVLIEAFRLAPEVLEAFKQVPEDQRAHVIDLVRTTLKMQGLL